MNQYLASTCTIFTTEILYVVDENGKGSSEKLINRPAILTPVCSKPAYFCNVFWGVKGHYSTVYIQYRHLHVLLLNKADPSLDAYSKNEPQVCQHYFVMPALVCILKPWTFITEQNNTGNISYGYTYNQIKN